MPFRIATKDFSLTYPKCDIPKEDLLEHLQKEKHVQYICIAEEKHQDQTNHLHAQVIFKRRKDIKRHDYFDFRGSHCNIQATANSEAWNNYIKQDGNFIEFGEKEKHLDLYQLARTTDHDAYFEHCRKEKIAFQYAQEAWRHCQQVDCTIYEGSIIEGKYDPTLNWHDTKIPFKTTVIIGPTGMGKTVFAKTKATKPCLFVSHMDDLRQYNQNLHKSIIFDDMSFTHIPVTGQIHLCDLFEARSIHIRYGIARLPKGTERWITCNSMPLADHEAIRRRINLINLY